MTKIDQTQNNYSSSQKTLLVHFCKIREKWTKELQPTFAEKSRKSVNYFQKRLSTESFSKYFVRSNQTC